MLLQDIRYAFRTLMRKPGFATMTILTLAVGHRRQRRDLQRRAIAVLLRPLPFPEPERARAGVLDDDARRPSATGSASPPDFIDWRRDSRSFADIAAINADAFALTGLGAAEQLPGAQVTGGFFNVLGVTAMLRPHAAAGRRAIGRAGRGRARSLALVAALRRRSACGRPHDYRSTAPRTRVVGVMPRGFAYPLESELWLPLRFTADETRRRSAARITST